MNFYYLKNESGEEIPGEISIPLLEGKYKSYIKDQIGGTYWLSFEDGGLVFHASNKKTLIGAVPFDLADPESKNSLEKKNKRLIG